MGKSSWFRVAILTASLLAAALGAAEETGAVRPGAAAEIRIGLPAGSEPTFAVHPGESRILVDLPAGATFPADLAAASGGILQGGTSAPVDPERVRLSIELGRGILERVRYGPGEIVLSFLDRFEGSPAEAGREDLYTLGPEDKIVVTVFDHPELSATLVVSRAGRITMPLLGEVEVAGRSAREAAELVQELLGRDFVVDPEVDVRVEEYNSQWVVVSGEVLRPGKVALRGGTDLKEIIADAGGLGPEAGEQITVSRREPDGGEPTTLTVDRTAFERGESNPRLRHGDIVGVGRAEYCYLYGEVRTPGKVRVERGLTLLKAVSQAGGLTEWARRKDVKVLREGSAGEVHNLDDIEDGKAEAPLLRGGDVVIVKRRAL